MPIDRDGVRGQEKAERACQVQGKIAAIGNGRSHTFCENDKITRVISCDLIKLFSLLCSFFLSKLCLPQFVELNCCEN